MNIATFNDKIKTPSTPILLIKFIKLDLKKDLPKRQVEKTVEEGSTLDSVRNLSTKQEEVGMGHQ